MVGRCWLLKTEPENFSIDDLAAAHQQTTAWDGVRNYQARNSLRDDLRVGDDCLIYHSGGTQPAVVGSAKVVRAAYPDVSALDPKSPAFDPASKADGPPRWWMVDVQLTSQFVRPLTLAEMRTIPALAKLELLRKGNRLSVQPVTRSEYALIIKLGGDRSKPKSKSTR
jgi:predicted RNA-binding protein with PUA-like domain